MALILFRGLSVPPHGIPTLAQATGISRGYYIQATYANLHSAKFLKPTHMPIARMKENLTMTPLSAGL